ncbi:hypothetical protein A2955_02315 [Candidatus Woesebacteria bacterium RIFCSPLOWO2_01_FULL_37_19]|uniref:Uncharacterized protein n=2 Tax=Candidatus Woeseibacteriota TaxID=1752722 RepID=A0A1F8BBM8_9BACT|nr:MAG: hypothetical protein A2771_00450 [Candidatus Woesebacteria bacterium RIFCSPHIGHO2_01_FULL_38_26b]OGM61467.1 MAG: hypothetical protein A2955_02315 [Candidatus Woesebacteria bacterium RIFCSPLOWO2_01_FULL_37_19]
MDEVKKILRAVINGQSALKQGLLAEIKKLRVEFTSKHDSLQKEMRDGFRKVNDRLDKQGKSLAYLEDDAPTREEHDKMDKRVDKLEKKFASV